MELFEELGAHFRLRQSHQCQIQYLLSLVPGLPQVGL